MAVDRNDSTPSTRARLGDEKGVLNARARLRRYFVIIFHLLQQSDCRMFGRWKPHPLVVARKSWKWAIIAGDDDNEAQQKDEKQEED